MGGGYYDRDVVSTSQGNSSTASTAAMSSSGFAKELDPKNRSIQCAAKTPIVVALDISGSMSEWPKVFYDKLPMFYGQLCMQGYVPDPALSFAAFAGGVQLQASGFAQRTSIDKNIKALYLCGGGGDGEPYADAAWYYLNKATFSGVPKGDKPYFFFTGDEYQGVFGKHLENNVKTTMDADAKGSFDDVQVWKDLMKKYHVFLVGKPGLPVAYWENILGKGRVLMLKTPKACVDCVLGAIAIVSGVRTLETYKATLATIGQTADRQAEVAEALKDLPALYPDAVKKAVARAVQAKFEAEEAEAASAAAAAAADTGATKSEGSIAAGMAAVSIGALDEEEEDAPT